MHRGPMRPLLAQYTSHALSKVRKRWMGRPTTRAVKYHRFVLVRADTWRVHLCWLTAIGAQMLVVHPNAAVPAKSGKRGGAARSASTLVTGSEAALPIEQRAFTAQQVPQNLHLSSGLTPPTAHIVQRRFDKTKRGLQCSVRRIYGVSCAVACAFDANGGA